MMKKISYDPIKRQETLKHRKLDFKSAKEILSGPLQYTHEDARLDYGEKRWITAGYFKKRMIIVVWTERDDSIRVISMRKANEKEQKKYKKRMD